MVKFYLPFLVSGHVASKLAAVLPLYSLECLFELASPELATRCTEAQGGKIEWENSPLGVLAQGGRLWAFKARPQSGGKPK